MKPGNALVVRVFLTSFLAFILIFDLLVKTFKEQLIINGIRNINLDNSYVFLFAFFSY